MDRAITDALVYLANQVACTVEYEAWSDELARDEIRKAFARVQEHLKDRVPDMLAGKTQDDLARLGFRRWEDESDTMLMPLWLIRVLPDDLKVTTIGGSVETLKDARSDNDIRFGVVAYGVSPQAK